MSRSRDDDERDRPRKPGDHLVSKLDAFRSDPLQALAQDILIVESRQGDGAVLSSLLRVLLGRHVETRLALVGNSLLLALTESSPNLVIWRDTLEGMAPSEEGVRQLRACGYHGPVVVVIDALSASASFGLRQAGVLDVIVKDDLDSVRLSQSLLRAVERKPLDSWQNASLM
jgi:PleD family two-component response regulator